MADERPQYQHGVGTIGGAQFHWGSGTPGKYWSIPYGDYPVTPDAPTGAWAHQAGAIPIANNVIPDSLLQRNRIGIMIHSGSSDSLDQLYTQGCFKVAPQEWPAVRSEILAEAAKGPLYLHVAPGGVASFTNTKTLEQASIPTAGSPLPAASAQPSRVATTTPGTSLNSSPLDIVLNAESGDRNINNTHATTSSGQAQGNAQITTGTWNDFAPKAGIDLKQYPTPDSAPRDVQIKVANVIPLNRWASSTVNAVLAKYPGINTSQTLGQIQSAAINPSGAPTTPAGGPAAPVATGQPGAAPFGSAGNMPGFQPNSPGAKMTAAGLKGLGLGGDAAAAAQPQPMQLAQAPPAQAVGGPMMMGPGGQNTMGQRTAQQDLAQRGFSMQPQLASAYGALGAAKPPVQTMAPGQATGIPGLMGTTLNSPSQLQMALMSGSINPYDVYANNPAYSSGFGST